jgi:hypothetical protein
MDLEISNRIGTTLSSLDLSLLPKPAGSNECYSIEHYDDTWEENGDPVEIEDQDYEVDGRIYPCTGAYYRFAMNKAGGAIFAQNLLKPQSAAEERFEGGLPDDLPELSRASDVMWGYWVRNNPNVKGLKFWIVNYVNNEVTLTLLSRALKNHGLNKMPYWPGLELKIDSEDARAILGESSSPPILLHTLLTDRRLTNRFHGCALPSPTQVCPWYQDLQQHHHLSGQHAREI